MIRALQPADTNDILSLLHWMDGAPEREVFAPDTRDPQELREDLEDGRAYVSDGPDGVDAYCGLRPFRDGLVLEGPLSAEPARLAPLVGRALHDADGLPVYAFCSRDNAAVRDALHAGGLNPMHSTAFYAAPLSRWSHPPSLPARLEFVERLPFEAYRELYRAAEDTWADRLAWTPDTFEAHFRHDDVRLLALLRDDQPVGFAELELHPAEGRANLTYLAVHPAERGQGYSRLLIAGAAALAARDEALSTLLVRAHDHMHAARALYTKLGFTQCRSVVTYLKETEDEA